MCFSIRVFILFTILSKDLYVGFAQKLWCRYLLVQLKKILGCAGGTSANKELSDNYQKLQLW